MHKLSQPSLLLAACCGIATSVSLSPTAVHAQLAPDCPQTSDSSNFTDSSLDAFTPDRNGTIYDNSGAHLRLQKAGGNFSSTNTAVADAMMGVCAADYDEDGWTDLVAYDSSRKFRFYKNQTYENPEPDWNDVNDVRVGKFVPGPVIADYGHHGGSAWIGCGDYNGDGHVDVVATWASSNNVTPGDARMFIGNGSGGFTSGHSLLTSLSHFNNISWSQNMISTDYNGDGRIDLIVGLQNGTSTGGKVQVFYNNGATQPKMTPGPVLVASAGMGNRGPLGLWFQDFTGDGHKDLIYTGPSSGTIRLHPGTGGNSISSTYQSIAYPAGKGGGNTIIASDFNLDGKLDIIVITDNWNFGSHIGGESYYYANDGDAQPFSSGATQQISFHNDPHTTGTLYDSDASTYLDYDNDPDHTLDLVVADGNHSAAFFLFANRVISTYVDCGEVKSGILDLGPLQNSELVVTAARMTPSHSLNGGSITYYMSNETPENWQLATPCPDNASDLCVSFPSPVGREVRWKADMCSNSSHTSTPTINGIAMKFDYKEAAVHYRAGVVVHDGVTYAGGFSQPGHRGYFYAVNAGLGTTYWDSSTKLDARSDSTRKIFTASTNGKTLLPFTTSNASSLLATLNAVDSDQATEIVNWVRSPRFGVGNTAFPLSRLGAIETSTPSVMTPPVKPSWYSHATSSQRGSVDSFINDNTSRELLVMFGSRDGMIHAIRNDPTQPTKTSNGDEAWGFIPAKVARRMLSDKTTGLATAYPDGSPTLADVRLADGEMHTVAIVSDGNGGNSIAALDVTETITSGGAVVGPDPLWHKTPGGNSAGSAFSKPVVARLKINDAERFVAIFGTGVSPVNANHGRVVFAVDMSTSRLLWRFKARCPLTSDIALYESDDEDEPTVPKIDGYHDFAIFADSCGYVYKLKPNVDYWTGTSWANTDGWIDSTIGGSIDTGQNDPDGKDIMAFFSTAGLASPTGLGEQRPIVGTIGARPDSTTRMVLFFGTGGIESYDPSKRNQFYALYSDTGEVRSVLEGECDIATGVCEKFYGGVVVTPEQVLLTRSVDPLVGSASCDNGSAVVAGLRLNDDADGNFITDFSVAMDSAIVAPLFGTGGALYTSTLGGLLVRIGTPRAVNSGDDTAAGVGQGTSDTGSGGGDAVGKLAVVGWRHLY